MDGIARRDLQGADIVEKAQVAEDENGRSYSRGGRAQGGCEHSVDPIGAAIAKQGSVAVRLSDESVEVAHRHAVAGMHGTTVRRQSHQLCNDLALEHRSFISEHRIERRARSRRCRKPRSEPRRYLRRVIKRLEQRVAQFNCPDLRYVRGYLKRIGPGSRLRDHQVGSARSRGEKLSEALGDGRIAKLDHGVRLISLAKRRVAEQDVVGIDDPRAVVMAGAKTRQWIGEDRPVEPLGQACNRAGGIRRRRGRTGYYQTSSAAAQFVGERANRIGWQTRTRGINSRVRRARFIRRDFAFTFALTDAPEP